VQRLDDMRGHNVPGAAVDDVELLATLVITGHRGVVAVDDLDHPLGILELHLLIAVLMSKLLVPFPLAERRAIVAWLLLLLLTELFHELLDLLALLNAVVPRVVHRAP
jgi:hypothetical protein